MILDVPCRQLECKQTGSPEGYVVACGSATKPNLNADPRCKKAVVPESRQRENKKKATDVGLEPTASALGGLRATIAPTGQCLDELCEIRGQEGTCSPQHGVKPPSTFTIMFPLTALRSVGPCPLGAFQRNRVRGLRNDRRSLLVALACGTNHYAVRLIFVQCIFEFARAAIQQQKSAAESMCACRLKVR